MKDWEKRLAHERTCRDALVACGNRAPSRPDPEGGLVTVQVRVFKGAVYFDFIKQRGHDHAEYNMCVCRK